MTPQEIVKEIKHLSIGERVSIIKQISQSVITDLNPNGFKTEDEDRELTIDERIAIAENLHGCLRAEGHFIPMTREEVREIIVEQLLEKYS